MDKGAYQMTFNFIVLLVAWAILFIVTIFQKRTINYQSKTNDYLLDDIARLENKNDSLDVKLRVAESKLYAERESSVKSESIRIELEERVQELENVLKLIDPDRRVIDFDGSLKPYPSTVKEVVDKHVR